MIGPWQFALVALAAWRTFHLFAEDTIVDLPRSWIIGPRPISDEAPIWQALRWERREQFLTCPFCLGFWVALAWVAAFWLEPHWTLVVAVPFAVSAAVAMLQLITDALTD